MENTPNAYTPSEVHTYQMSKEEMDKDKAEQKRLRERFPWRYKKGDRNSDSGSHQIGNMNNSMKKIRRNKLKDKRNHRHWHVP